MFYIICKYTRLRIQLYYYECTWLSMCLLVIKVVLAEPYVDYASNVLCAMIQNVRYNMDQGYTMCIKIEMRWAIYNMYQDQNEMFVVRLNPLVIYDSYLCPSESSVNI